MTRRPTKRPSFFKVLISKDFTRQLPLPPAFLQKHGSKLLENVKLKISSGRTWNVKVEKMEGCFSQGWRNFAEDVRLKFGEFLVFEFDCKSSFDVSVYGTNACEKEFPVGYFQVEESDPDEDLHELIKVECNAENHNGRNVVNKRRSKGAGASELDHPVEESNPLYFEIRLKHHHRSRLTLARRFSASAGLVGKEMVGLKYATKDYYQSVKLDHREANRIDMTKGWPEFKVANGLVVGKTYSFEFKPSKNVIQVREIKQVN